MKADKEQIFGADFEKQRKKIKKDKNYFASLDNKEVSEEIVENGRKNLLPAKPEKEESIPALPFGLK